MLAMVMRAAIASTSDMVARLPGYPVARCCAGKPGNRETGQPSKIKIHQYHRVPGRLRVVISRAGGGAVEVVEVAVAARIDAVVVEGVVDLQGDASPAGDGVGDVRVENEVRRRFEGVVVG